MLKVNEIMQLSLFKNFKFVCGEDGLDNPVVCVVILEYESIQTNYEGFNTGDFVLASLFFTRDTPDFVYKALETVIKRRVSAIALKTTFSEAIPQYLIELAAEYNVPLFTFSNAYMEDLIININESLKTKSQYLVYEEKLHNIIDTSPDPHTVKNVAKEINPTFHPYLFTAYITPIDEVSSITIHSYFKRLVYKQFRDRNSYDYSFVKYNSGIILIYSYPDTSIPKPDSLLFMIESLLTEIEFNPATFYIGISDIPAKLSTLDVSVRHAIYTNFVCRKNQEHSIHYTQTGIYQYLLPLVYSPLVYHNVREKINLLIEYDSSYSSNLLDTMIVYIKNNGDIKQTSSEIFQHTNTVRYRIKKAASILSLDEENSYESLFLLISIYTLHQQIKVDYPED